VYVACWDIVNLSWFLSFGHEFSRVAVIGDPCILGILAAQRFALVVGGRAGKMFESRKSPKPEKGL
jgi:hypothetical protein